MARALSDTIIISMIEAATRLASGRGPAGSGAGHSAATSGGTHTEAGGPVGQESGATTDSATTNETATPAPAAHGSAEHDTRSAEQIGADFKTIYLQIEEVVKSSAEQETKAVGFGVR